MYILVSDPLHLSDEAWAGTGFRRGPTDIMLYFALTCVMYYIQFLFIFDSEHFCKYTFWLVTPSTWVMRLRQEQGLGGVQLAAWCLADDPNIQACIHLFHFCIFVSKYINIFRPISRIISIGFISSFVCFLFGDYCKRTSFCFNYWQSLQPKYAIQQT